MVMTSAETAVSVRHRLPGERGTGLDTVTWPQVAAEARTAPDPHLG
jgi:hypothetical protein